MYKVVRSESGCECDEGRGVVLMWDVIHKHLTTVLHWEWLKETLAHTLVQSDNAVRIACSLENLRVP